MRLFEVEQNLGHTKTYAAEGKWKSLCDGNSIDQRIFYLNYLQIFKGYQMVIFFMGNQIDISFF